MSHEYRDRLYIRKDILLTLSEYGYLNQTNLLSYCGLNMGKHKNILGSLQKMGFVKSAETSWGSKKIIKYAITEKGRQFYRMILEPYEEFFPRSERTDKEQIYQCHGGSIRL
ncbi:MAG: winged helix-turn-helix domain-containing protein [Rhabdochlamydiaceae bacterium]